MKKRIIGCLLITSIVLSGCSLWKPKNTEDDRKPMEQNSAEFDWGNYQKAIYQNRTLIKECNANYQKDISAIKQKENKMLDFSDCKFEPIDEVKSVSVLQEQILDVTPEQSVNTIKQWLKDIHKEDINTDKEIRDASGQYPNNDVDENTDSSDYWPAVADHYPDFKTGSGFFINTNQCHIQMGAGIYSMSDGAITRYLGTNGMAGLDALGSNSEDVKAEGFVSEMKDQSWELLSRKVTVDEGAKIAKRYFEEGKYFPVAQGVTIDVPEVSVFALKNKYGYDYTIRRKYEGIPFAYGDYGQRNLYDGYQVTPDVKHAYVVNDQTVSAYVGQSESNSLKKIGKEQDSIIDCKKAVSILQKSMATELKINVKRVAFVYCKCAFGEEQNETPDYYAFPCWEFQGENSNNQEYLHLYVDALTGAVYMYGNQIEQ